MSGFSKNDLLKQDWRSRKKVQIVQYVFLKWGLALLIGLTTGLVGFFNNLAVENIAGFKLLLANKIMVQQRYLLSFASFAGCNVILATCAAVLCAYVAPAAAGSGIPEVKAYLNGVDVHSILAPNTLFVKDYMQKNPNVTVLDPPDAIKHVSNRQSMLEDVAGLNLLDCYGTSLHFLILSYLLVVNPEAFWAIFGCMKFDYVTMFRLYRTFILCRS